VRGTNEATAYPPLGLALLAAVLERAGHELRILDAALHGLGPTEVLAEARRFGTDLLGIHLNVVSAREGTALARAARDAGLRVVLGGPFATAFHRELVEDLAPVAVVRGEGEESLAEIAAGRPPEEVAGLSWSDGKEVRVNPPRPPLADLDALPLPAYHLLPPFASYRSRARRFPVAPLLSSRGCPHGCSYCNTNIFGRRFRPRSPQSVLAEIEWLVRRHGVRQIDILDDNFTQDADRAAAILEGIVSGGLELALNLQNGVRADRLDRELVRLMARAGVFKAGIGIESGNEAVRRGIGKRLDLGDARRAIEWFRAEGIVPVGFFMLGLPQDTPATMEETIRVSLALDPAIAVFSRFVPLPGTAAYELLEARGWLRSDFRQGIPSGFLGGEALWERPDLPARVVRRHLRRAYLRFYARPGKLLELARGLRSSREWAWTFRAGLGLVRDLASRRRPEPEEL